MSRGSVTVTVRPLPSRGTADTSPWWAWAMARTMDRPSPAPFIGALYLQRVLGYGELLTGTAFLPAPIVIGMLMLALPARVVGRYGAYRVLLAGLALITVGMGLLGRASAGGSYAVDVLPAMLLLSVGFAAAMPALTGLAMSGAQEEDGGRRRDCSIPRR